MSELEYVSEMIPKILHDPEYFDLFLKDMSVTVTEMFRDPAVFKTIRHDICEHLRTYPRINIWHAGCATGEEVYSMAIVLYEEGLLDKCQIYATDYNNHSLTVAEKGFYPAEYMKQFSDNYHASGAKASFADYFKVKYGSAKVSKMLQERITFANHNLMKDQVFAKMHLVMCRNVLIYFDKVLQNQVLSLFSDSLIRRCYLVLGSRESLEFSSVEDRFELTHKHEKIYRKKNVL